MTKFGETSRGAPQRILRWWVRSSLSLRSRRSLKAISDRVEHLFRLTQPTFLAMHSTKKEHLDAADSKDCENLNQYCSLINSNSSADRPATAAPSLSHQIQSKESDDRTQTDADFRRSPPAHPILPADLPCLCSNTEYVQMEKIFSSCVFVSPLRMRR